MSAIKLPLSVNLQQEVVALLSVTYCPSIIILENAKCGYGTSPPI
jgi:hypothetical protein